MEEDKERDLEILNNYQNKEVQGIKKLLEEKNIFMTMLIGALTLT